MEHSPKNPPKPSFKCNENNSFSRLSFEKRIPQIFQRAKKEIECFLEGQNLDKSDKEVVKELERYFENCTSNVFQMLTSDREDTAIWNQLISAGFKNTLLIDGPFLFTECYMYRKFYDIVQKSHKLESFDYFSSSKQEELNRLIKNNLIEKLIIVYLKCDKIQNVLKLNLWCNKFDLSLLTNTQTEALDHTFIEEIDSLQKDLLCDNSIECGKYITKGLERIDLVLDNSGMELFVDLCLAHYLINRKFCKKVVIHCKQIPWFVSDATKNDVKWMLLELNNLESVIVQNFKDEINKYITQGSIEIVDNVFWTLPLSYWHLNDYETCEISKNSNLIVFKGDLNYRKLTYDCKWNFDDSFEKAIGPLANKEARVLALRVCKADVVVGLNEEIVKKTQKENENWKTNGTYGLIQFI